MDEKINTPYIQKEYKKARSTLLKKVRSLRERGYIISSDLIPEIPSEKTLKSVNELRDINNNIYEKIKYLNSETGELISGIRGRRIEKYKSYAKEKETKTRKAETQTKFYRENNLGNHGKEPNTSVGATLSWVRKQLEEWEGLSNWSSDLNMLKEDDKNRLTSILTSAIANLGEKQVAKNIQDNAIAVMDYVMQILYGSGDGTGTKEGFASGRSAVNNSLSLLESIFTGDKTTIEHSKIYSEYGEEYESEY